MMFFKNVKLIFWGEATLCTTYIRNQYPSSVINKKIPYKMWYNRLPLVKHFRVFSSQCYGLIPKQQRTKLSERSKKCIFVGYSMTSNAYLLYDEDTKKFILSRDVIFLEFDKDSLILDRQLNHIEMFVPQKFYYEKNNIIPHLEGGIPNRFSFSQ